MRAGAARRQASALAPRAGLTKMVSKLSKEGGFRKGLEVFQALPELGIAPDTAITNSAISACDKGALSRAARATARRRGRAGAPRRRGAPECIARRAHSRSPSRLWLRTCPARRRGLHARAACASISQAAGATGRKCEGLRSAGGRAGGQWQAALELFRAMDAMGLRRDAITYSSVISALAKGRQWAHALQARARAW